jgi:hypothetical protein
MDPRTFLPPRSTTPARAPEVGERAPELPVALDGRPTIVAFLRHAGCPFAEATFRALRELPDELRVVAVSHATEDASATWCDAVGGRGRVELLVDRDRSVYAAWGLGRTSLGHFMGRRSLREVRRLAREGIRNRHPSGTRWQTAGTYALDGEGVVRWRHLPEHAGDLPDLGEAARLLTPPR